MTTHAHSARAFTARALTAAVFTAATVALAGLTVSSATAAPKDIRWGTGPVGSSGHKALVVLADLLNKEMPEFRISVLPYPGAVGTVKSFATGDLDGYYGSDVALKEFAADNERFKGFKASVKVQPVQSFWCYTLDVGVAIKAADAATMKSWHDLTGKNVYTGPLPFDTRKHLENAFKALGVKHVYKQVDLKTAGSQLDNGSIKAMIIYAAGGKTPAPWISEASLAVDWEALNPSADELKMLKAKKFAVEQIPATNFHKKDAKVKNITLLPFYWGFDLGMAASEDEVYKMLKVIEKHADELGKLDTSFAQIGGGKMAEFQKAALEVTADLVPIHPGLAKYLKEKKMWDSAWDAHVAKAKAM
jgi:TRAP transporter TAXI family solute receptor